MDINLISYCFITFILTAITVYGIYRIKLKNILLLKDDIKQQLEQQISVNQVLEQKYLLKNQELELLKMSTETIQKQSEGIEKRMVLEFENLSSKIMDDSIEKFQTNSARNIGQILDPLKEKISSFQHKIEHLYTEEAKERHSLKNEIINISNIGNQLNQEALNLTKALKGDVKAQGNWGEMVLEKILENSGLRKGEEYITQGQGMGLKSDDGHQQKPDIVIMLPENKHIIVDSKVSLTHYERFISLDDDSLKQDALKQFNDSIESHVKDLSKKDYANLDKLGTPDFVLMFFPIEGSYSLAIQQNPNLFYWAWERSIIIVGPTTLMATLKTIHSIWRQEKSNRNAQAIATESGKMYDKMANFLTDLLKVGEQLKRTDDTYQNSLNKLKQGKGNVLSRLEHIKGLGAKAKKQIDIPHDDLESLDIDLNQ
jgi:DNA recombination protein RmuC